MRSLISNTWQNKKISFLQAMLLSLLRIVTFARIPESTKGKLNYTIANSFHRVSILLRIFYERAKRNMRRNPMVQCPMFHCSHSTNVDFISVFEKLSVYDLM